MTKPPAMPELPEKLIFSERLAISEAAQVQIDAECCRIIQATLDYIRSNYALAALQPQPAAAVSDAEIEEIARGKSNHIEFARAILALRPQAVPMTVEPFLKVHKGEICYKSDADDQSYGMWCPVNWDTEHGFSDGTVFYAHHGITQRADAAHQPAKEPK